MSVFPCSLINIDALRKKKIPSWAILILNGCSSGLGPGENWRSQFDRSRRRVKRKPLFSFLSRRPARVHAVGMNYAWPGEPLFRDFDIVDNVLKGSNRLQLSLFWSILRFENKSFKILFFCSGFELSNIVRAFEASSNR